MQYIWQHRLWPATDMFTVDGRKIHVIDPGRLNTDSGPDFFNAKIYIDGRLWAGDVEIHVRATDWHRHGHDGDPAYNSVILHVVDLDDGPITRPDGQTIPQMRMPCAPDFHLRYSQLVDAPAASLPCASHIAALSPLHISDWISSLTYERIYAKTDRIGSILSRLHGDWESACYITIARALGFGINGEPFERLAFSLPLNIIGKHADSLMAIEALLFGQSGLIVPSDDPYIVGLQREYAFLSHKFALSPPQSLGWKMARMRPANFPHRRIATLAAMLYGGFSMLSRILEIENLDRARLIFAPQLTGFWRNHYNFGAPSGSCPPSLGLSSVTGLVINAVVPLQMAYGTAHDDRSLTDRAVELLQSLPPENNTIVDLFTRAGIRCRDAFTSQALIQLRRQYCEPRKCLYCRIGHRMLAARAPRITV